MKSVTIFVIEECIAGEGTYTLAVAKTRPHAEKILDLLLSERGGSRDRESPGIEERPFDTPDSYAAMIKATKERFKV